MSLPLFDAYPGLAKSTPHVSLGKFPTPVEPCPALADETGAQSVWIKRDDLSGDRFGGNKVRKLEFLLAEAQRRGCTEVMTYGYAGSNHALCTAYYARKLGLRSIAMLMPQPNAPVVRRNLLLNLALGADIREYPSQKAVATASTALAAQRKVETGRAPMSIPGGGSSALGTLGFVNAVFELKNQIDAGELPMPGVIYVATGSMGTTAGIHAGMKLLEMPIQLEAVRVTDEKFASSTVGAELANKTLKLMQRRDGAVPKVSIDPESVPLRDEFFGNGYGVYTGASAHGMQVFREHTGLAIEGTYTGKAFAALLADGAAGKLGGQNVLFLNTFNSWDFSKEIEGADYHKLPAAFHKYFEEDVQPLSKAAALD
jgi:1-aminocyclopropane-1-carboxylate deaminase/D-cysteine desulfhydrase-like pyridoxal-dependent ACC family enzyme